MGRLEQVSAKIVNISTRGFVQTGDNVMIGGLIVTGNDPSEVLIRAIGPSLPVSDRLADPHLELFNSEGTAIFANDNWKNSQREQIEASRIPPSDELESAMRATLPPGNYTAIVSGADGGTGVALVEVYQLAP